MIRKKPLPVPKVEYFRAYSTEKDLRPAYDKYIEASDENGYNDFFIYE